MTKVHPVLTRLLQRAKQLPATIVLPEGHDERIQQAAVLAAAQGIAQPVLLGDKAVLMQALGKSASDGLVRVIDPQAPDYIEQFIEPYVALRAHKGATADTARVAMSDPMQLAAMLVRQGHADASVGGAVASTADTVRAALQIIGKASGTEVVSSAMLMLNEPHQSDIPEALVFADCALVVDPDSTELVHIALAAADTYRALMDDTPYVALLSFSTAGSARHPRVSKMQEATAQLRKAHPGLAVGGELQFDAALMPEIARRKAPDSAVAGRANVLVFPSLEAGNIGYKIAQRLGGVISVGPILQGLAKPANDLSRGCSTEDIVQLLAITSLQVKAATQPES